jgi:general secretion pathway protein A
VIDGHQPGAGPGSYLEFYGLAERPFSLTSNPRFLYNSRGFSLAWADVVGAVEQRQGLVVITGERGVGKSSLCRALLEKLGTDAFLSAIANPRISADDFLRQVLADFGAIDDEHIAGAEDVTALEKFLVSHAPPDVQAIILVEEAQHLSLTVFEQIRLLTNLEAETGKRLQILLVGPSDLHSRLHRPLLRSFRQRVACWADMSPLQPDEVGPYIEWRLGVARGDASGTAVQFTPPAVDAIAVASQGNPRLVNVIADRALEIGYARGIRAIDRQTAHAAIARAGFEVGSRSGLTPARSAAIAVLVAAIVGSAFWWQLVARRGPQQPRAVTEQPTPVTGPRAPETEQPPPAPSPSGEGTLAAADSFLLTLGPYTDTERASAVAREIGAGGLPAFTRVDVAGNAYDVMVGPYVSREEAIEAQRQIAALRYPVARIVVERH